MLIRPRIIPTLLIRNGDLVKTKKFDKPRYLGDPINAIRIFNEKSVDELCVLDIVASKEHRKPDYDLLKNMASEAFMPLSYGGGITDIEDIKRIFRIGYEKVVVNTATIGNNSLIREASKYFGSQSIVVAIDYARSLFGPFCRINDGTQKTHIAPSQQALNATEAGAGEILLYSIDNDGMRCGYDLEMISEISHRINVPVIACGGAKNMSDISKALDAGASAVAAGSMFVFWGDRQAVLINYPSEEELINYGIYK